MIELRITPSLRVDGGIDLMSTHDDVNRELLFGLHPSVQINHLEVFTEEFNKTHKPKPTQYWNITYGDKIVKFPIISMFEEYNKTIPIDILYDHDTTIMTMFVIVEIVDKNILEYVKSQPHWFELTDNKYGFPTYEIGIGDCSKFGVSRNINLKNYDAYAKLIFPKYFNKYYVTNELYNVLIKSYPRDFATTFNVLCNLPNDFIEYIINTDTLKFHLNWFGHLTFDLSQEHMFQFVSYIKDAIANTYDEDIIQTVNEVYEIYKQVINTTNKPTVYVETSAKNMYDMFLNLAGVYTNKYTYPIAIKTISKDSLQRYMKYPFKGTNNLFFDDVYIGSVLLNTEMIEDKYNDITNNVTRLSWWLDGVMPYVLHRRFYMMLNCGYDKGKLNIFMSLAGLIGLWSMFSEYGNGCNSWILLHPIKDFMLFSEELLAIRPYNMLLKKLGFGEIIYDINDQLIEVFNKVLSDFDHNIFNSLQLSVEWVKHVANEYDILKYITYKNKLKNVDDIIASPSGLNIVPWEIIY